jgi:ABC-2 type transport system ATP-binding protein
MLAAEADMTIEVAKLSKRFGSTLAVQDLSFTVRPGHVTGFLGPNGAGKSTTMRMILGLDRPSAGQAWVNGRPYGELHRPLHQVGALLDARAVHDGRSGYQHLLCLAQSNGIGKPRVDAVVEIVGLGSAIHRRAGAYSLGMAQRLGIAAALLGDPGVLLFDEPVNGLDPEGIVWIRNLLRSLAAQGRTVFVSSHLMSEMALTADRIVVIGRGCLIADCGTQEFIDRSATNYIRVRSPEVDLLAAALRAAGADVTTGDDDSLIVTRVGLATVGDLACDLGVAVHELSAQQASLEEAYLELTQDSLEFSATVGRQTTPDAVPAVTPAAVPAAATVKEQDDEH